MTGDHGTIRTRARIHSHQDAAQPCFGEPTPACSALEAQAIQTDALSVKEPLFAECIYNMKDCATCESRVSLLVERILVCGFWLLDIEAVRKRRGTRMP